MKWTIHELTKNQSQDNTFEAVLDFSDRINGSDILKISEVEISGDYEIYDNNEYVFFINIVCTLTMGCAITLDNVDVQLDFEVEEIFTANKDDEFNMIEGITIDLLPIIWSNIILEKPMRVVSANAQHDFESDNIEIEAVNDVFSKLKDFKN